MHKAGLIVALALGAAVSTAEARDARPVAPGAPRLPLPFALEADQVPLGASFPDYQYYPMPEQQPRPLESDRYGDAVHAGLDFRVPAGTPVHAIRGGDVQMTGRLEYHTTITIHELGEDGRRTGGRWEYAHLDYDSIPASIREAAETGGSVEAGTHLGEVTAWIEGEEWVPDQIDIGDGKRYDHLHLNYIVRDGSGTEHYVNLRPYMALAEDTVAPTIEALYFVADGDHRAIPGRRPRLQGRVDLVLQGYDRQRPGDGFELGIYGAEVQVLAPEADRVLARMEMPAFDSLGRKADNVRARYLRALETEDGQQRARGDRFGKTSFLVVTNAVNGEPDPVGAMHTRKLPDGPYRVRVIVRDEAGNTRTVERDVIIANGSS